MLDFSETRSLLKNLIQESDIDYSQKGLKLNLYLDDFLNILNKHTQEKVTLEINEDHIDITRNP